MLFKEKIQDNFSIWTRLKDESAFIFTGRFGEFAQYLKITHAERYADVGSQILLGTSAEFGKIRFEFADNIVDGISGDLYHTECGIVAKQLFDIRHVDANHAFLGQNRCQGLTYGGGICYNNNLYFNSNCRKIIKNLQ